MRPPAASLRRLLEDHQVDRRGVQVQQCIELTRTNSRPLDRVDLSPGDHPRGHRLDTKHNSYRCHFEFQIADFRLLIYKSAICNLKFFSIPVDHTRVDTLSPLPNAAV